MVDLFQEIYPREIILEVTNKCNLRCRHCHFHGQDAERKRPLGSMKRDVWENIIEELASWPEPVALLTHGAGEPLVYPELYNLIRKVTQIPNVSVGFMTNGMLLDRTWAERLVSLQVDCIALSIDGVIPETHDYFRRNADLGIIESNVFRLIEEKGRRGSDLPLLNFNMVAYPEILDQTEDYVKKWLPHAGTVTISTFRPIGSRELWTGSPPFRFRPCPLLYHQMVVSWDGKAGLCCEDINLDVPLGDVTDNSLREIYNTSSSLLEYRRSHESGKIGNLALCRDCHIWGGNIELKRKRYELGGMDVEKVVSPAFQVHRKIEK